MRVLSRPPSTVTATSRSIGATDHLILFRQGLCVRGAISMCVLQMLVFHPSTSALSQQHNLYHFQLKQGCSVHF
jgi:hypothetical protein